MRVWFDSVEAPATAGDRLLAAIAAPLALPLSWLVAAVARRRQSRIPRQAADATAPPVVVVGNLVAGGAGKTPLAGAIALGLRQYGFRPGLLAGGYRSAAGGPRLVEDSSSEAEVGDEALLLAQETGLPLAVGRDRSAAAALLRRRHPECDVLVSDDGLQHVGLPRRLELLVVDERGFGNRRCLPAGPLRETVRRIESVDAVVLTSPRAQAPQGAPRLFHSNLHPNGFRRLAGADQWELEDFVRQFGREPMTAIAGIARPQRFFDLLASLGLRPVCHALPDHGRIDPAWLDALPGRWLLMTGKDAVRCQYFEAGLRGRCVRLDVAAVPEPALLKWIATELRSQAHGNG